MSRTNRSLLVWAMSISSRVFFRRIVQGAAADQSERAGDRGQRRAQLVTHRRDELILDALHGFALGDVAGDAEVHFFAGDPHFRHGELHGKDRAVLALPFDLAAEADDLGAPPSR